VRGRQHLDLAHLLEHGEVGVAHEEPLAGEHLVETDAQGEDVAAAVQRQATNLLRLMYPNLPLRMPACVLVALPAALAMPKSITFTSPSYETSAFCGETSR